jgi:hypothetical protein
MFCNFIDEALQQEATKIYPFAHTETTGILTTDYRKICELRHTWYGTHAFHERRKNGLYA